MENCRRNRLLASVAALMVLSPLSTLPARADALSPIIGSFSGHFNNMEDFFNPATGAIVTAGFGGTGQQNFGIDVLGSISSSSGGVYGGPGTGDFLVGVFGGITVGPGFNNTTGAPAATFAPGTTFFNTGGTFHIYEVPQADFASTAAFNSFLNSSGPSGFTGAGCGGQTLAQVAAGTSFCFSGLTNLAGVKDVLDISLVPGFNSFTTTGGTVIPLGASYTLQASLNSTLSGVANGWGDVIGGTDAAQFHTLGELTQIGTLADVSLIDDFCQESPTCASIYAGSDNLNWTAASSDPINGNAVAVPEPGTLALFGTALLGIGAVRRRRKQR